jgi:hypothetical protein
MKRSLREQAPSVIKAGEDQLREVPNTFAAYLQNQLDQKLEAARPEAEAKLYEALKQSLDEADKHVAEVGGNTKNDEEKFKVLLDTLVSTYGTQTTKLLDDLHARYKGGATDILSHLDRLAEGKNLDAKEEAQRSMIRNFLVLAREYHAGTHGAPAPAGTAASGGGATAQPAAAETKAEPGLGAEAPKPDAPAAQPAAEQPAGDPASPPAAPAADPAAQPK